MFVVERAKKCLDFGGTVYFYHLIFTSIYSVRVRTTTLSAQRHSTSPPCNLQGFPVHWEWWVTHIVALVVMVVLGKVQPVINILVTT